MKKLIVLLLFAICISLTSCKKSKNETSIEKFNVTFDLNGGNLVSGSLNQEVNKGDDATAPILNKDGYTYSFDKAFDNVTSNLTVTAVWEIVTYDISYILNDSTNNSLNPTSYNINNGFTLSNPSKLNYDFLGWTSNTVTTPTKNLSIPSGTFGNLTFTAVFSEVTYSVTYNLAGGVNNSSNKASYKASDTTFNLLNPTKDGQTFIGWYDENNHKVESIKSGSNKNYVLNAIWSSYSLIDDYIYYGMYPQTQITDTSIIDGLNDLGGALPNADDSKLWTSFDYFRSGSNLIDFSWYIDLNYLNQNYRGVYFSQFRDAYTTTSSSTYGQNRNGYELSTVYWFVYEPIKWNILDQYEDEGDCALLFSDLVLDSHEFNDKTTEAGTVKGNSWSNSTLREWLSTSFTDYSFSQSQKDILINQTNQNNVSITGGNNGASSTDDKVYLLSYEDSINASYGFDTSKSSSATRIKYATDYAKAQGCFVDLNTSKAYWRLRSPGSSQENSGYVDLNGSILGASVAITAYGVAPVVSIKL